MNLLPYSPFLLQCTNTIAMLPLKYLICRAMKGNVCTDYISRLQSQNELSSNLSFERCLFLLLWQITQSS